mmetsp:Transcript_17415/g.22362  ORF Transcript_17415/g.22362 Transcript_17415/m.22362 type:complete len:122 (-) Transcript_17415:206-571(-)
MKSFYAICVACIFFVAGTYGFIANTQSLKNISKHAARDVKMMGKPVTVTWLPSGKTCEAEQGDEIAKVAAKAGIKLKFDCKTGRCGTCEVRLNNRVTAKVCQGAKIPGGPTKALKIEPKTK